MPSLAWSSLLTIASPCPSGMASFLLRRSPSGMSEKRSATELAFTCFSILSIVSSSRFGRKGCASTISWSDASTPANG